MELRIEHQTATNTAPAPRLVTTQAQVSAAPSPPIEAAQAESGPDRPNLQVVLTKALRSSGTLLDQHNLELDVDDTTGRTVGRIVNADTGEVLVQIPSKEMLALIARISEALGPLVDERV